MDRPTLTIPARQKTPLYLAGAAGMLVLLLAALGIAQVKFNSLADADRSHIRSYKVLLDIDQLDGLIDDANDTLLASSGSSEPPGAAEWSILEQGQKAIGYLKVQTADEPEQQSTLYLLGRDYDNWENQYFLPLKGDHGAALLGKLNAEAPARDLARKHLHGRISLLNAHERAAVARSEEWQRVSQESAAFTLILVGALSTLYSCALIILLGKNLNATRLVAQNLKQANFQLQAEVDERRSAESALAQSEQRFRLLADDSVDLICRHRPDGRYFYVSASSKVLLGYEPEEMVGHSPYEYIHPEDTAAVVEHHQQQLEMPDRRMVTYRFRCADDRFIWLETVSHAITGGDSPQVLEIHTTSRDVTSRRRDDERRQRMMRGLHSIVEAAYELLGIGDESSLLRRSVELARDKLGVERCAIYLSSDSPNTLVAAYGADFEGDTSEENENIVHFKANWRDELGFGVNDRWVLTREPLFRYGNFARGPERLREGWVAVTLLAAARGDVGVFVHDTMVTGRAHDLIEQELVAVYASILGTLVDRLRVESSRRQVEEQLRLVVDSAPLLLYAIDENERYILQVGKALSRFGIVPNQSVGMTLDEANGDESGKEIVRRVLRGETISSTVQNGPVSVEVHRQPLYDDNGRIKGMIGVGFDVTERQEADSARRASEARYRLVVESAKEVIFQLDSELRWSLLNSAWVEIFGFELDESLGRRVTDFVHPMDRDRVARDLRALSAGELSSLENEVRFLSKTGDVIWMDALARRVVDDPGEPGAADSIVGTLSNITERRLAEEQLLATTSLQDAILNGANYSILSWRSDGTIQLFNRAAEKLLGYQAREVVDRANPLLFHDAQELAQRSQQIAESRGLIVAPGLDVLTALARDGGVDEHEWTYIRRNGSRFPVRLSVTALRGPEREVVGYVAFGYDLTDTRRVERLKNEFVSVVSHELRTPLTSIRGALGLLAGGVAGVLPENAANMIGIAQKNSERLVLLINDILDVEKIESGKMRFDLAPVPLGQLLQSAVDANQPYAESLGVSILVEARDADLARMTVTGDEARLMQVLANLLSNASKFTPEGGVVRLRLERTTNHPVGEWARILVQDTGPGVPESFVSSLFEKFAQADASSTRRQGGTGLGLAIARAIVDKHGGQIGYLPPDPERGRAGATFFFDLPVYPGDAGEKADVPVADDRPTILICEDDGEVAQLISMILDHGGFRTERVYGVAQARAALARKRYAAMTLDLLLPDGDGFELLRHLRAEASTRDLPVVVVSTERKTADQLSVFALGVVDWLHKPIDAPRLLEAVGRLSRPPHGIPRILHVEDDRDVRQVTEAIVGNAGFVVPASSLREARTQLMTSHFDLVILDIALPDGSGLDLVPLLNGAAPPIPVILFSAREPFEHEAVDVSAALVKSRTSNEALLETIEGLLNS